MPDVPRLVSLARTAALAALAALAAPAALGVLASASGCVFDPNIDASAPLQQIRCASTAECPPTWTCGGGLGAPTALAGDIDGACRDNAGAPDIGADER